VGLRETVKRLEAVEDGGAGLSVLSLDGEMVDTKSATGTLILTIFPGFAQFEREMMRLRRLHSRSVNRARRMVERSPLGVCMRPPPLVLRNGSARDRPLPQIPGRGASASIAASRSTIASRKRRTRSGSRGFEGKRAQIGVGSLRHPGRTRTRRPS